MTDYTDLLKAAECAAQDTIKFADEDEEMRAHQQFHEEVDPETVLALIAEKDAMAGLLKRFVDGEHEQDENQAERHMYFTEAQSLLALVIGELEAHTIVPDSAIKAIHAERDQLRVEVAGLRTGYEAYERVNAELRAENEALRMNSSRYEWLKVNSSVMLKKTASYTTGLGLINTIYPAASELDLAIDAAMRKGSQS